MSTSLPITSVLRSSALDCASIVLYFSRRYPVRSLVTIACLALSGIVEGASITLFIPLLQRITGDAAGAGGRLGDFIFWGFAQMGIQPTLLALLCGIILGMTVKGIFYWTAMNQVGYTISRVATDLRLQLLRALINARWAYFAGQLAGQFANALASEALKASGAYQSAAYVAACAIQLIVYTVLAFMLSWQTAVAALGAGLLFVLLMHRLVNVTRLAGKQQVALMKSMTGRVVDMLHGLKPVKAMGREAALMGYLESEAEGLNKAQRSEVQAAATMAAAQEPVMAILMAVGVYVITTLHLMPLPALLVQAFLFSRLFNQVNQIIQHYQRLTAYESAFASIHGRITEARLHGEPSVGEPAPLHLKQGIRFVDVTFGYDDRVLFEKVSMDIPARRWTVLIGPSGVGKTTLLDLLAGLYSPQEGEVRLDNKPLTDIALASWRSRIGYVPQEMLLLHDSVLANVTIGEPDVGRAAVEEALRQADAWDFVSALPAGMDTPVGERGSRLSGGQRQRIALARALVRKPELLILDEVTASLDPATEAALCQTLQRLGRTTTIVAISHQPALAQVADRVYEVRDRTITLVNRKAEE